MQLRRVMILKDYRSCERFWRAVSTLAWLRVHYLRHRAVGDLIVIVRFERGLLAR